MFSFLSVVVGGESNGDKIIGDVKIISNQTEYKPLTHWVSGTSDGLVADGFYLGPEYATGKVNNSISRNLSWDISELATVFYSDDFQLLVEGDFFTWGSYSLFKNEYEVKILDEPVLGSYEEYKYKAIKEKSTSFDEIKNILKGVDDGEYILELFLLWSNQDENTENLKSSQIQYFFKIVVGSGETDAMTTTVITETISDSTTIGQFMAFGNVNDVNPPTGVVLGMIPVVLAGIAAWASQKKR